MKKSSLLSQLLFLEITPLIRLGRKRILQPEDFLPLPEALHPRTLPFDEKTIPETTPWAFMRAILWQLRPTLARAYACNIGYVVFLLLSPYILQKLVQAATSGFPTYAEISIAVFLAVCLGVCNLLTGLMGQQYFYYTLTSIQVVGNFLNRRIFEHSLWLTQGSRAESPTGDVVNHMGSDSDSVADLPLVLGDLNISVMTVIGAGVSLWFLFGSAALLAIVMLAVMIPLTQLVSKRFSFLEDELMADRDKRITLMTQILNGIRIVKFFVWEKSVKREVDALRQRELHRRWQLVLTESLTMVAYMAISLIALFVTLFIHVARGGKLEASSLFAAVALFQLLAEPFGQLAQIVSRLVYARVGADRILRFLKKESLPRDLRLADEAIPQIEASNLRAQYAGMPVLEEVSFSLKAGESLAIVGAVGSGKTTLLNILLGELPIADGSLHFTDKEGNAVVPRVAFVPQEAFIINDTLKNNILFGQQATQEQILRAISLACLDRDISELPGGINTEIGERGVNLSGGQKQRVGIARGVLHRPTLVLMDDPLSALDPRTEQHIVRRLLFGEWQGVTRIVVTHRLAHLRNFDKILFLDQGRVEALGTFHELWHGHQPFRTLVANYVEPPIESSPEDSPSIGRPITLKDTDDESNIAARLTDAEERQVGAVKTRLYLDYLLALGGKNRRWRNILMLLLGVAVVSILPLLQRLWLAKSVQWQNHASIIPTNLWDQLASNPFSSVIIYGLLALIVIFFVCINDVFWIKRGLIAGKNLHDDTLNSVLGARLRFFDSTPIGRVLQRFSRDVESVDFFLQAGFKQTVQIFAEIVLALILIVSLLPIMIVVVIPVGWFYFVLQRDYRGPARESKRLDSISRSPRYAHFKETLQGLVVIRAFRKTEMFQDMFFERLANSQKMFRAMYMINRWFSCRIPILGSVISVTTALGLIWASHVGALSSAIVAVVLVYLLTFWQMLNRGIRWFSELEARMTSVERLQFYSRLEQEEPCGVEQKKDWPSQGALTFKSVSLRYAKHLPEVLSGLSFAIPAGAKVGIVGRTGSGKSTLLQALFRSVELSEGAILLDGVDISRLGLAQLRRALAIIPQDPILFVGTLRSNLDRYREHTDLEVWRALDRAKLGDLVRSLPAQLETRVEENGVNFSLGQRQLLCLSRALLADAKVIVLDEATASVDVLTDDLVQRVVRESCRDKTMLIIAHRLNTVADADYLLELDKGQIVSWRKNLAVLADSTQGKAQASGKSEQANYKD